MARGDVVALVSGGLESLCLTGWLLTQGATVRPLYVRCGLGWEPAEQWWLARWLARLRRPHLKGLVRLEVPVRVMYGAHWSLTGRGVPSARSPDAAVYLPGRNVLLLAHAAVYAIGCRASTLALGTLASNPFRDASPGFFKRLASCLTEALSSPIRIITPLRPFSKPQLIKASSALPLRLTFSCLRPRGMRHCGECNKCTERRRAFRQAGVPDLTPYAR